MDSLLQTSAACCGLYAYRPTRGTVSRAGMTLVAGDLDSVAWVCRTPSLLPRLGDAFCLPGIVHWTLCMGGIQSCSRLSAQLSVSLCLSINVSFSGIHTQKPPKHVLEVNFIIFIRKQICRLQSFFMFFRDACQTCQLAEKFSMRASIAQPLHQADALTKLQHVVFVIEARPTSLFL